MIFAPDSPLVAAVHPSPNFEPRSPAVRTSILLLHYTGMSSAAKAVDWLSRPESKVSSHYVIDEHGVVTQLVPESERAWHAGVSWWAGLRDINSASVGIEIQNPGHEDGYPEFPEAQMKVVAELSREIVARHNIPPQRVLAHSDVAPVRKIDPGEKFDWARLAKAGVGHWVEPVPVKNKDRGLEIGHAGALIMEVQGMLKRYGYGIEDHGDFDEPTRFVVKAFQRHFRPARVDGRIDQSTISTLEKLLGALTVPATS